MICCIVHNCTTYPQNGWAVRFQMCSLIGWFSTLRTLVQFLSSVNHHVDSKITSLSKWFAALHTLVWLFSSVNHHVGSKITSRRKCFAALRTLVCLLLSRMGDLVIIQTSSLLKCFLALVTFINVLSTAVGRHIVHTGSAVCLWTQVTRVCHHWGPTLCKEWWTYTEGYI